jgi:hypothetical protein
LSGEQGNLIGYALCFEKKLCDSNNAVSNEAFFYRTFGHFDGVSVKEVIKVSDFTYYRKNYRLFKLKTFKNRTDEHMHYHLEKQLLNCLLYDEELFPNEKPDIFNSESNKEAPVVVVTIVNKYDTPVNAKEIVEIKGNLSNLISAVDAENKFSFEVFQTLSIEDYVIVSRANNLNCIYETLMKFRHLPPFNAINLYSIVSLDCNKNVSPTRQDKITATLRLYVKPIANFDGVVRGISKIIEEENPNINIVKVSDCFDEYRIQHDSTYTSFGRFDIQLTLSATSLNHLMKLYDRVNTSINDEKEQDANPDAEWLKDIISTETTILSPMLSLKNNNERIPDYTNNYSDLTEFIKMFRQDIIDKISNDTTLKDNGEKLNRDEKINLQGVICRHEPISGNTDLSEELCNRISTKWGTRLTEPIYMLIERVHQLHHASFSHKYSKIIEKFAYNFVKAVPNFLINNKLNIKIGSSEITMFVDRIIGNIDNLFSISFRDFELAQKDGMQIHSSGEILIALKRYVDNEIETAKRVFLSHNNNKKVKYNNYISYNIVMAALQSGVTVASIPSIESFVNEDDNIPTECFSVVSIPPHMLYDISLALFALSHEAGHFVVFPDSKGNAIENYNAKKCIPEFDLFEGNDIAKDIVRKFFHEFTADAFAVNSLNMKNAKTKSRDLFDAFILTVTPTDEINGVHMALRMGAFRKVLLELDLEQDFYNEDINKVFSKEMFDDTIRLAEEFYKDYAHMFIEANLYDSKLVSHLDFKENFTSTLYGEDCLPQITDKNKTRLFISLLRELKTMDNT